jgi:hypothetical protein
MIKKITTLATLILLSTITYGQLVRVYPESAYFLEFDKEKVNKTVPIKIRWTKNDASTLDNIDFVEYPDGYFKILTYPKYEDKTKGGKPIFKCTVMDENDKQMTCYIVKNSEEIITLGLMYTNVIIGFSVDLTNFSIEK